MMKRIFLFGCNGRMGKVVTGMCDERDDVKIVAGADVHTGGCTYPVYKDPYACEEDFDVIVDFSHVSALPSVMSFASTRKKPLVMCTTGLSEKNKADLKALAKEVPVFYSANMSLGINVLSHVAQKAAKLLYPEFDIEIIEAHHNQKVDAPSGTALLLADRINESLDNQLSYVYDRHTAREKRRKNELGLHAIRAGNIVGDHSVVFAGPEETLTLSHHAQTRNVYARGAVAAAVYMCKKKSGMYSMDHLMSD